MEKVLSVVGARPNFMKLSAVHLQLGKNKKIRHIIVHTGQHYDKELSKNFFRDLKIPLPEYNLKIGSCSREKQVSKIIERLEKILLKENPNLVLVYGDTNSALGGALCASKNGFMRACRSWIALPRQNNA